MSVIGVIGGSGLYEIPGLRISREWALSTPFGEPSAPYVMGELSGHPVAFLPRHGPDHRIPPHRINYRANIWGFKELGVRRLISVNACGGISPSYRPGDIVVADQVIDMTQGARQGTFFDEGEVFHIDFTDPYCPELRAALIGAGSRAGVPLRDGGTYICVNGPRLESRAEIMFFGRMEVDLVGMTGMPEAALAREAEICFSVLAMVTNFAAGLTGRKLTTVEVMQTMAASSESLKRILTEALPLIPREHGCPCGSALEDSKLG